MRRLVSLALVVAVAACGSDSTSEPTNASVAGTWNLQSVNGSGLPYTAATTPAKIEILSGTVTATAAGAWTSSTQVRTTISGQATTATSTDGGTFTLSGNNVAITSAQNGVVGAGTISGNTLTLTQTAGVLVYTKQ